MLSKKIGMLFTFLDSALLPQLSNGLYGEGGDGMINMYLQILMLIMLTLTCIFVSILGVWAIRTMIKDTKEEKANDQR